MLKKFAGYYKHHLKLFVLDMLCAFTVAVLNLVYPRVAGKIIEVKDFEDLVNIEEELRVPILFYELIHESESWFIITTSTQAYRYILKSHADLEEIYNKGNKTKENI